MKFWEYLQPTAAVGAYLAPNDASCWCHLRATNDTENSFVKIPRALQMNIVIVTHSKKGKWSFQLPSIIIIGKRRDLKVCIFLSTNNQLHAALGKVGCKCVRHCCFPGREEKQQQLSEKLCLACTVLLGMGVLLNHILRGFQ